jgi:hypothetical protein
MTRPIPTARRRWRVRIPALFYRHHSSRPGLVVRTDHRGSGRLWVELTADEIATLAREAVDATSGDDPDARVRARSLLAALSRLGG